MHDITPRRMDFPFTPADVPVYWFGDNATASMAVNSINLIFPDGERFFIRSVRQFLPELTDPELIKQARHFFAQEALHGREHERANDVLRAQGFELDSWLTWYQRVAYRRLERWTPPVFCLAVTAALEHLTASLAHQTLTIRPLRTAVPLMQDLMDWHAAEEIEHKSVAFDVLAAVDGRWWLRVAGMVIGLATFLFFWRSARRHLFKQDPEITPARIRRDRAQVRSWGITDTRRKLIHFALQYLRPSFHPDDQDDYALAEATLSRLERKYIKAEKVG